MRIQKIFSYQFKQIIIETKVLRNELTHKLNLMLIFKD